MKKRVVLLIPVIPLIFGMFACDREGRDEYSENNPDTLFFDDFEDLEASNSIWNLQGLAGISDYDTSNNFLSVSSFTQRDMGNTSHGDGMAFSSISGFESDSLHFELSFQAFIDPDDGPAVLKLYQIKGDTETELIHVYENSTSDWTDYKLYGKIFNLREEDTIRILIHNTIGFTVGTHQARYDNILLRIINPR